MKARRRLLIMTIALSSAASGSAAWAGDGGRLTLSNVSRIYKQSWYQPPNVGTNFETFNLSADDTVLHIQADDAEGSYVAGNDDCNPWQGDHSCVYVPGTPGGRLLWVLVRSYAGGTGTAQLRITNDGSAPQESAVFDFGGVQVTDFYATYLNPGSKIYTTRKLGANAPNDTIILALSSWERAVAFDDDDGIGLMSAISSLPGPYAASTVIVGVKTWGTTTLVWDEDIGAPGGDPDGDGLGNGLESALGTSTSTVDGDGDGVPDGRDTDNDGISDGLEIKGQESTTSDPHLELPTWGAEPTVKDIFVEVDWNPSCSQPPGCTPLNNYRYTAQLALNAVTAWWGPTTGGAQPASDQRVRLHADIGVANNVSVGDPSLIQWGDWGGAKIRTAMGDSACNTLTANRLNVFHLAVADGGFSGSAGAGTCVVVGLGDQTLAHELGHNLGLPHHGSPAAGIINAKAVYASVMNYAFPNHPFLSSATFRGVNFNPISVNEQTWLGSNTTADLNLLVNIGYNRQGNWIDWNEDGVFQSTGIRARVNRLQESGRMLDDGWPTGLGQNIAGPALAWYAAPSGPRLYVAYQRKVDATNWKPAVRYQEEIETLCNIPYFAPSTNPDGDNCTNWQPNADVPSAETTNMGVGATDFSVGGVRKMFLVYANTSGLLRYQLLTVTSAGGGGTWTVPSTAMGSTAVTGSPSVVFDEAANRMEVLAPSAGKLRRWSADVDTFIWDVKAVDQAWTGGGTVPAPGSGAGLAWGYRQGDASKSLFAVIPNGTSAVTFARRDGTNLWAQHTAPNIAADARPGLAYVPFSNGTPSIGRFYVAARLWGDPYIVMTRGNDGTCPGTGERSLCWWQQATNMYGSFDDAYAGDFALLYDWTRDSNLRGATPQSEQGGTQSIWFQPMADGLINFTAFRDQNDYDFLKKNLKCSFNTALCKQCAALDSVGNCTTWF